MGRPRSFDEATVLDQAMEVFRRAGYEGATMAMLSAAMGLSAPSIYAAFESKRGLFEAVLERFSACEKQKRDGILSAPSASEVAERLLLDAAESLPRSASAAAPLPLSIGAAMSAGSDDISSLLAKHRLVVEIALQERFERAIAEGDLSDQANARDLTIDLLTVLDGLAVRAAAGRDAGELRSLAQRALSSWKAGLPVIHAHSGGTNAGIEERRGRPRQFRREEAVDAAIRVFWERGYDGASMTDLTDAMGITRSSLYAAFGSKQDLFLQALDRYEEARLLIAREALDAPKLHDAIKELLHQAVTAQCSPSSPRGCFMAMNAMQGSDEARLIRSEVLKRDRTFARLLAERIERAQQEGELAPDANIAGLTAHLRAILQGIVAGGHAGFDQGQLAALTNSFQRILERPEYRSVYNKR